MHRFPLRSFFSQTWLRKLSFLSGVYWPRQKGHPNQSPLHAPGKKAGAGVKVVAPVVRCASSVTVLTERKSRRAQSSANSGGASGSVPYPELPSQLFRVASIAHTTLLGHGVEGVLHLRFCGCPVLAGALRSSTPLRGISNRTPMCDGEEKAA